MIGSDDPRLTTYAVDEVDAATAAAIEQTLRESASARAAVTEAEEAGALLAEVFAAEPSPALHVAQRDAIEAAAARAVMSPSRWRPLLLGAVAAAVLVSVGLWLRQGARTPAVREVSVATAAPDVAAPAAAPSTPAPSASPAPPAAPRRTAPPTTVRLRGVVTDEAGAVIPGATLTVRLIETGAERQATTSNKGTFNLTGLPPGRWEVRAELPGFKVSSNTVWAPPGVVLSWRPTLRMASMAETITVVADTPMIETATGMRATTTEAGPAAYGYATTGRGFNTEAYAARIDNPFVEVRAHALSTFSLDVDTASYSNVRRFLVDDEELPPADAVRIEELVNYFPYDYPAPRGKQRFAADLELASAPWKAEHLLLRVGLKTREIDLAHRPSANLVFLVDVSGSMDEPNKLPLVQESLRMLVDKLTADDHVALAVYAGQAGLVLPSTPGDQKQTILAAIDHLQAGGSTNGAEGIELAYEQASEHFVKGGINRVILATDGDFNVGLTDEGSLMRLIQQKATSGVFLSVLGFGMGNLKDSTMEMLSDKGNGNYAYIDSAREARKALVEQIAGTLITVAKDVKIQVEFNPAQVRAYRLIGYENRLLRPEDFKDDTKDAGEVGAGHTVTALYELVPAKRAWSGPQLDPLRYQSPAGLTAAAHSAEILRLKLRYKEPQGSKSKLQEWTLDEHGTSLAEASADFRFAAAVASFGMLLRDAPDKGSTTFATVLDLAQGGHGNDPSGYRAEFIELVKKAQALSAQAREDVSRP